MYELIDAIKAAIGPWELWVRLVVAAIFGAVVGVEREHHGRSAGFRTQLLVALGAALAMVVSEHFAIEYGDTSSMKSIRVDPARIAYGVMGGIGFLGAGAIIRYGVGVRGLTTAASLWCTAAIGLACGCGMYGEAIFSTGIVVFALVVLSKLEFLIHSRSYKSVIMKFPVSDHDNIARCQELFRQKKVRVVDWSYQRQSSPDIETVTFHICLKSSSELKGIVRLVAAFPDISEFKVD